MNLWPSTFILRPLQEPQPSWWKPVIKFGYCSAASVLWVWFSTIRVMGTFDSACVLTHFTPTTLTVACLQPRSPCLWCTYAHWPEHAGIRAGVLFYDWVTALISCLVIRSLLISLPCWKQLSLSPRLVWSCGLSLLWFFLSVTDWEHWGPLKWWGCTMGAIKYLSVQVFLKEVF